MTGPSFTAQRRGICIDCEDDIVPGQQCRYDVDDNVIHVICPDSIHPTQPPCSSCRLVHAGGCF